MGKFGFALGMTLMTSHAGLLGAVNPSDRGVDEMLVRTQFDKFV
eukprot:CAMPEP_0205925860 /NCGR_PEP_ID=MMETSP1325-20131115/19151_1 /ASSEMBLY_ACC=CAM_ASM_000708 /TAXON_ID=236786 /ORGANISM="Florenciella sp., Strain RCC1007" /LENGTH=43 /DNA_ID= /DNA_START= /DNA_END= /DNA_ORIENTATION=